MTLVIAIIFSGFVIGLVNIILVSISTFQHKYLRHSVVGYFTCLLIIFTEHLIEYAGYSCAFPFTIYISAALYLLLFPILNVIVNSMFGQEVSRSNFLIEILPALGFFIIMIPFYASSGEHKCDYLNNYIVVNSVDSYKHLVLVATLTAQTLLYSFFWKKKFHNYIQLVKSRTSSGDIEFIPWVSRLLLVIVTFTLVIILSRVGRIYSPGNYYALDQIGNVVLSLFPVVFLFLLFFLPDQPFPSPIQESPSENRTKVFDPILKDQLLKLMEREQLYLLPDLSLSQVAEIMELSRHNLSNLLSQGFQKSFYDFVNDYRVTYAKKLMDSDMIKTFSLSGIARESGFNSYVSFYRVFKRIEKQTPSQYLRK
ncbi:MAG: helix-turn-helix domain-containing protein [Cyclobacteriaceae bacterium]